VSTAVRKPATLRTKLLLAILPPLLLLGTGEVVFQIKTWFRPKYHFMPGRIDNPAYLQHEWFSEAFLIASATAPKGFTKAGPGGVILLPNDYRDQWITTSGGYRRTVGFSPPADGRVRRLLVLGGSTTFCNEVPDEFTWPSLLQARLAADPATADVEVVNAGAMGAGTFQELERLKHELARGPRPDFVVSLHGVNDVTQGVYNNRPDLTLSGYAEEIERTWAQRLMRKSRLFEFLVQTFRPALQAPPHLSDPAAVERAVRASAENYRANLRAMAELCAREGIGFVAFLQPSMYTITSRPLTEAELRVGELKHPGMRRAFAAGHPALQREAAGLREREGVNVIDASDGFDAERRPIFLDFCHVEELGNRAIVERVFPAIRAMLDAREQAPATGR
jgi:lysophospholipase L1-like esterase